MVFQEIWTSIAKETYMYCFVIFSREGGGIWDPPPSGSTHDHFLFCSMFLLLFHNYKALRRL